MSHVVERKRGPGGGVLYNDEEVSDMTWGEVKSKHASMLIYECYTDPYRDKQHVQRRLDFSEGSTGATCGGESSRGSPASRKGVRAGQVRKRYDIGGARKGEKERRKEKKKEKKKETERESEKDR